MANSVEITGYVNGVKKISENLSVFSVAYGVKQEDGSYKNIFINCKTKDASVEDGKRYDVTGFLTGSHYTPEGSDKERGALELWVQTAVEAPAGE